MTTSRFAASFRESSDIERCHEAIQEPIYGCGGRRTSTRTLSSWRCSSRVFWTCFRKDGLPSTVQSIRSAAGGGKTSLLRLFTPPVLRRLHARRVDEQEFFERLRELGVIDETGPQLLGVSLLCGRNYAVLEDLPLDEGSRRRLFLEPLECARNPGGPAQRVGAARPGVSRESSAGSDGCGRGV